MLFNADNPLASVAVNEKSLSFPLFLEEMCRRLFPDKKTTTVSDPTKATVVAGNNAMNGSQTLTIDKIANTGYITGAQLAKGTTANS